MSRKFLNSVLITVFLFASALQFTPPEFVYEHFVKQGHAGDISQLDGITSQIGDEDVNWGTGQATDTFSVPTYAGSYVTLTKLPALAANLASIIKGKWYVSSNATIADHGNVLTQGSIAWVANVIGTDLLTLELPEANYPIGTSLTLASNIVLDPQPGAMIQPATGKTLTIGKLKEPGRWQWLDATTGGTVSFAAGSISHALPEWAGADPLGVADSTAAIAFVYAAIPNYGVYSFESGTYKTTSTLTFSGNKHVHFKGNNTTLAYGGTSTTSDCFVWGDGSTQQSLVFIDGFTFISNTTMTSGTGVHLKQLVRSDIKDVKFDHQDGTGKFYHGVWFEGFDNVNIIGYQARAQQDAIRFNGANTSVYYPKADLKFSHGKVAKSTVGFHAGGGAGGIHILQTDIINNKTNMTVNQTILTELGLAAASNREITLAATTGMDSACTTLDAATFDGINLDIDDTSGFIFLKSVWNASAGTLIRVGSSYAGILQIDGGLMFNAFNTYGGNGYGIELLGTGAHIRLNGTVFRNIDGPSIICTNASPAQNVHTSGLVFESDASIPRLTNVAAQTDASSGAFNLNIPLYSSLSPQTTWIMGTGGKNTIGVAHFGDSAVSGWLEFAKSRSNVVGGQGILKDNDVLGGGLLFSGSDGVALISGAYIRAVVDGTPGVDDMPTALEFYTRRVGGTEPLVTLTLNPSGTATIASVPAHADNAAAVAAGLAVGTLYRTGDNVKVVH